MCYAPARRSHQLIQRANELITEGKTPEAERLLAAARNAMGRVVNVEYNGKRIGEHYNDAQQALLRLKRQDTPSAFSG